MSRLIAWTTAETRAPGRVWPAATLDHGSSHPLASPDGTSVRNLTLAKWLPDFKIETGPAIVACLDLSKEPKRLPHRRIPEIGFCEEKNRLLGKFLQAIHELNTLNTEQMQAVVNEDFDFSARE